MQSRARGKQALFAITFLIACSDVPAHIADEDKEISTVFSCTFKSGKSVHLSKFTRGKNRMLAYSFGFPEKTELRFEGEASKSGPFFYGEFRQRRADLFEIGFTNNGFTYLISRDQPGDDKPVVYDLEMGGTGPKGIIHVKLRCDRDVVDNGLTDQTDVRCDRGANLPCNKDDMGSAGFAW
jgi:hypothetical protein